MSFDHLPESVEEGVQRFADELHISHDEALIRLLQGALAAHGSVAEQADADLPARVRRGPRPPRDTSNPEAIIGLFAGDEAFSKSIDAVISRRAERYGRKE